MGRSYGRSRVIPDEIGSNAKCSFCSTQTCGVLLAGAGEGECGQGGGAHGGAGSVLGEAHSVFSGAPRRGRVAVSRYVHRRYPQGSRQGLSARGVDTYGSYAFGFLYVPKQPEAAVAVLPFYRRFKLAVKAVLTGNGREFCGTGRPLYTPSALARFRHSPHLAVITVRFWPRNGIFVRFSFLRCQVPKPRPCINIGLQDGELFLGENLSANLAPPRSCLHTSPGSKFPLLSSIGATSITRSPCTKTTKSHLFPFIPCAGKARSTSTMTRSVPTPFNETSQPSLLQDVARFSSPTLERIPHKDSAISRSRH